MAKARGKAAAALAFVVLGGGILVALLSAVPPGSSGTVDSPWIGPWLWEARGLDIAVQALLVLAGVLGILLILGPREAGP